MTFTSVSVIFLYQPAMLFSVCKTYSWCKPHIVQELCSECKTYSGYKALYRAGTLQQV